VPLQLAEHGRVSAQLAQRLAPSGGACPLLDRRPRRRRIAVRGAKRARERGLGLLGCAGLVGGQRASRRSARFARSLA
jgi:hypothetical protein